MSITWLFRAKIVYYFLPMLLSDLNFIQSRFYFIQVWCWLLSPRVLYFWFADFDTLQPSWTPQHLKAIPMQFILNQIKQSKKKHPKTLVDSIYKAYKMLHNDFVGNVCMPCHHSSKWFLWLTRLHFVNNLLDTTRQQKKLLDLMELSPSMLEYKEANYLNLDLNLQAKI